jgi:hypothetical protein
MDLWSLLPVAFETTKQKRVLDRQIFGPASSSNLVAVAQLFLHLF